MSEVATEWVCPGCKQPWPGPHGEGCTGSSGLMRAPNAIPADALIQVEAGYVAELRARCERAEAALREIESLLERPEDSTFLLNMATDIAERALSGARPGDENVSESAFQWASEASRRLTLSALTGPIFSRAEQLQRDFDLVYEANANWCARCVRAEAALRERDAAVQRVGEAWDRYISENVGGGWYKRLGEAMAALRALSGARPGEGQ